MGKAPLYGPASEVAGRLFSSDAAGISLQCRDRSAAVTAPSAHQRDRPYSGMSGRRRSACRCSRDDGTRPTWASSTCRSESPSSRPVCFTIGAGLAYDRSRATAGGYVRSASMC